MLTRAFIFQLFRQTADDAFQTRRQLSLFTNIFHKSFPDTFLKSVPTIISNHRRIKTQKKKYSQSKQFISITIFQNVRLIVLKSAHIRQERDRQTYHADINKVPADPIPSFFSKKRKKNRIK